MIRDERIHMLRREQIGIIYLREGENYAHGNEAYLNYRECEIYAEIDRMEGKMPRGIVDSAK